MDLVAGLEPMGPAHGIGSDLACHNSALRDGHLQESPRMRKDGVDSKRMAAACMVEVTGCTHCAHSRDIEAAALVGNRAKDNCFQDCLPGYVVLQFASDLPLGSHRSLLGVHLFAHLYQSPDLYHRVSDLLLDLAR